MSLSPTECHERLDAAGLLDDAQGPGTYAVRVDTPDDVESIARAFLAVSDATPPDEVIERLTAERVCYVGASGCVYDRIMDHCRGEVRKATFLEAFDVVDLVGVWPAEAPFREEFNRAAELSREGWTCWQDGEVI